MSTVAATPEAPRSEARAARSERLRLLLRSPLVVAGAIVVAFWIFCALFPGVVCPYNPIFDNNFPPNEHPSWAPDGKHLVFASTRGGRSQIYSMLADGSQVQQLTTQGINDRPVVKLQT